MAKAVKQNQSAIWVAPDGKFSAVSPFQRGTAGLSGLTIPGAGDKTSLFGTDGLGNPYVVDTERGQPGSPSATVQNYVTLAQDTIQKMLQTGKVQDIQIRFHDCVPLDIATGWEILVNMSNVSIGDVSIGDAPTREFNSSRVEQDVSINPDFIVWWFSQALTRQTTAETMSANSVWFLDEPDSLADCGNGYPGLDQVGFVAYDADTGVVAEIEFTVTGGSTWTACTATDPFAINEHAGHVTGTVISKTQGRVLVSRITTDGSNPAEIAYGDFSLSSGDVTAWNLVNVGSTNGEIITATFWSRRNPNRVYAATDGGDIYLSTNRGESFAATFTGSNNINAFYESADGYIYAVGDSNTILVEKNSSGTFDGLTGPTGSDASNSIAVTQDAIWLGNGTSIFYTRNLEPAAAGDWTESKDFGGSTTVKAISPKGRGRFPGGSSQMLHVMENDGSTGSVWLTPDGGGTWQQITAVANSGYNDAHFSQVDDNFGIIVGEANSGTGLIHKLSA